MSLDELIKCARRELVMRERVYPGFIKRGTMTPLKAAHEIECMKEIVATLERLARTAGINLFEE